MLDLATSQPGGLSRGAEEVFYELMACRSSTHRTFMELQPKTPAVLQQYRPLTALRLDYEQLLASECPEDTVAAIEARLGTALATLTIGPDPTDSTGGLPQGLAGQMAQELQLGLLLCQAARGPIEYSASDHAVQHARAAGFYMPPTQQAPSSAHQPSLCVLGAGVDLQGEGIDVLSQLEAALSEYEKCAYGTWQRPQPMLQPTTPTPTMHTPTDHAAGQAPDQTHAPAQAVQGGSEGQEEDTKHYRKMRYWDEISRPGDVRVEFVVGPDGAPTGALKWVSFNRLVEHYTWYFGASADFQPRDFTFPKDMLRTHLWFTTSHDLLDKLIEVYNVPNGHKDAERIKGAVCKGLRFWMQKQMQDFLVPHWLDPTLQDMVAPDMRQRLDGLYALLDKEQAHMADMLRTTFDKLLQYQRDRRDKLLARGAPASRQREYRGDFDSLPLDGLAEQLTLMEFDCFHAIQMRDLKAKRWVDQDPACPVLRMISHFNSVSTWVVHTVITQDTPEKRARTIDRFRQLACILKDMYNFNTMMAIDGALQHTAVERMKRTFDELSDKKQAALDELKAFTSPFHNYANYRRAQSERNGFCIPYIGLYLRDLIHTEDGQPTWTQGGGMVNFVKMAMLADNALEIQRCQEIVPSFLPQPALMAQLVHLLALDVKDDDLYRISRDMEPRAMQQQDRPSPKSSPKASRDSKRDDRRRGLDPTTAAEVEKLAGGLLQRFAKDPAVGLQRAELDELLGALPELREIEVMDRDLPACMNRLQLEGVVASVWATANSKKSFSTLGKGKAKIKCIRLLAQIYQVAAMPSTISPDLEATAADDDQ